MSISAEGMHQIALSSSDWRGKSSETAFKSSVSGGVIILTVRHSCGESMKG